MTRAKAKMTTTTDVLLDELLQTCQSPQDILGTQGVVHQLTKRLVERALQGELTHRRQRLRARMPALRIRQATRLRVMAHQAAQRSTVIRGLPSHCPMAAMPGLQLHEPSGIVGRSGRRVSVPLVPSIRATSGHAYEQAASGHRIGVAILMNPGIPHRDSLA